ncbi:DHH family phosphoesterase [Geminocystis herdmanii]|uniref:DHH family phosphoesterase n=1 Tax=Geminocystis herdmanii TaxID=669359 RepID=UPI000346DE3F|nr:DHH family phosphoesterase [Geminocystis herdmanii]
MDSYSWEIIPSIDIPQWFLAEIKTDVNNSDIDFLGQLLWNRGIRDIDNLRELLNCHETQSLSGDEFGQEMKRGIQSLQQAWVNQEKVVIWGDSFIDGVIATAILIEGLKPFFSLQNHQLSYYISPTEIKGLTREGIDLLNQREVKLILVVDMGCQSLEMISYAQDLEIDIIIIDHHILPVARPPVISFLNPLNFAENHPFYHLSAVGIAYKLLESLYQEFSQEKPDKLLDLVALGLLASGDNIKGESRYLLKKGIELISLEKRLYITRLIKTCENSKDKITDYQKGLGIRLNVFNSLYKKDNLLLKLLTTENPRLWGELVMKVEQSYRIFVELKEKIIKQFKQKIASLDLSNNKIIILHNNSWDRKLLPLISRFLSQEYRHPIILFSSDENSIAQRRFTIEQRRFTIAQRHFVIEYGYCYAHSSLNLWELLHNQRDLLISITKYHQEIEISLPSENINLLTDNLNQQLRNKSNSLSSTKKIDLIVSIEQLGKKLYNELKLIEPFTFDNPYPKLLIKNCWFTKTSDKKKDNHGNKLPLNTVYFTLNDESCSQGIEGKWEGHYNNEINQQSRYDAIIELDYHLQKNLYFVKIIDLKIAQENTTFYRNINHLPTIVDYRSNLTLLNNIDHREILVNECPLQWQEITDKSQKAIDNQKDLVLAYQHQNNLDIEQLWQTLIKLIKQNIQKSEEISIEEILPLLAIKKDTLKIILNALQEINISYQIVGNKIKFRQNQANFLPENYVKVKNIFEEIIYQENLQKNYFYQAPIPIIQEEIKLIYD